MLLKFLKIAVALAIALTLLVGVGGLLVSPEFTVSRSTVVNAPPAAVYALLSSPRAWKDWTVWNRRDPAMQLSYSGPEQGAGAVWSWVSATEGTGRMTFTQAEPDRRLAYDLYFPDFDSNSTGELTLTVEGAATRVTWAMRGNAGPNPLMRWVSLFSDRLIGPDFEAGLANLKTLAERR
ncbi:MAG TPA: SRPBCC family protein [Methylibium sp.]|nr:SRPBCC family protein [Methylibium sp.]